MKIFISYRRDDSRHAAGRLREILGARFGVDNIFIDVDAIPVGVKYADHIANAIDACDAFIVVIGDEWLATADEDGVQRLSKADDFVRIELEAALRRDVAVIPLVLDQTPMPRAQDLPESLRPLLNYQAAKLRAGPDFKVDVKRIMRDLEKRAPQPSIWRRRPTRLKAGALALALLGATAVGASVLMPQWSGPRACLMHGSSKMALETHDDGRFAIRYLDPNPGITRHHVKKGTLLVNGMRAPDGTVEASARAFYRRCPAPLVYSVSGTITQGSDFTLAGERPVRDVSRPGCPLTGEERPDRLSFERTWC